VDDDDIVRGIGDTTVDILDAEQVDAAVSLAPTDFVVNTSIAGAQRLTFVDSHTGRQVASAPDGSFFVTFVNDCATLSRCDILARRFGADGRPLVNGVSEDAGEFVVNLTNEFTAMPAIAAGGAGVFVTWVGELNEIRGVALDLDGGHATAFDNTLSINPVTNAFEPSVAALSSGEFIVVWSQQLETVDDWQIRGRLIDGNGSPLVNPTTGDTLDFPISTAATGIADRPVVASTGSGREFFVVWRHRDSEFAGGNVRGRFYGASAGPLSAVEAQLTNYVDRQVFAPHAIARANGTAGVVWGVRDLFDPELAGGALMFAQFAAPSGAAVGSPSVLDRGLLSEGVATPAITLDRDGVIVAAWHGCGSRGDDSGCGVWVQPLHDSGLPIGEPQQVNSTTTGDQEGPSLAATAEALAIAFSDDSRTVPDTSESAVRARLFYPNTVLTNGQVGARCGAGDAPCGASLMCVPAADDDALCHRNCDPGATTPCPDGGTCTRFDEQSACVF
jgi:hypothetical protein